MTDIKEAEPSAGSEVARLLEEEKRVKKIYELITKDISRFGLPKMDAEDVIQDTMYITFLKSETLKDMDKFEPWVRRIAVNAALQHIRKKNRDMLVGEGIVDMLDAVHQGKALGMPDDFEILQREELFRQIQQKLKKLDGKYAKILELYYFQDYSLQQAAEFMDLNYNTAKTLHSRALKKLRINLESLL